MYIADVNYVRFVVRSTGTRTNFAGTGDSGTTGEGSAATASPLNYARGVAVDSSNNVYVADQYCPRIKMIARSTLTMTTVVGSATCACYTAAVGGGSSTGTSGSTTMGSTCTMTTVGDGLAATSAYLYNPFGLTMDQSNNLYIAGTLSLPMIVSFFQRYGRRFLHVMPQINIGCGC